ncbi:MAG: dihydrofolate reductase family protein [Saprospiraceae bacterium]
MNFMRKIIYHVATTLDGFIAHNDGSFVGFLPKGDHVADFLDSIKHYGAILMGKNTYEVGYTYGMKPGDPAYADFNADMKNYVFSRSAAFESNNRVQLVRENEIDFIKNLKTEPGKDIWLCGGGALAGSLLHNELIDELWLKLNPVVFGSGITLFGDNKQKIDLVFLNSKTYESGVLLLQYKISYHSPYQSS